VGFKSFQVGNYRFVELLDRGGSAEVFRVESPDDRGFLKSFAVKRVTTHSAHDDKCAEHLRREAKIHSLLTHPNIARLYDVVRAGNSLFLVVEYVEGLNLKTVSQRLVQREKTVGLDLSVHLIHQICLGMAYAHNVKDPATHRPLRIVHRDLSPRNVMVSSDGSVKVIDFGIASATNVTRNTATGCVRGTIAYMSPEQASGQSVDQRSDIYSVGLMLLELLTGGRIFEGDSEIELLQRITEGRLPKASSLNPAVGEKLDRIVATATARIPGDRYQSMEAFRSDLASCLTLDPSEANDQLAALIKPLLKEKGGNEASSYWEEAVLSPQEERAMREGFRKLEGALGIELESYHRTNKDQQIDYRQRLDWERPPEESWGKRNRSVVIMALLFSLSIGAMIARHVKPTAKKAVQVTKAQLSP